MHEVQVCVQAWLNTHTCMTIYCVQCCACMHVHACMYRISGRDCPKEMKKAFARATYCTLAGWVGGCMCVCASSVWKHVACWGRLQRCCAISGQPWILCCVVFHGISNSMIWALIQLGIGCMRPCMFYTFVFQFGSTLCVCLHILWIINRMQHVHAFIIYIHHPCEFAANRKAISAMVLLRLKTHKSIIILIVLAILMCYIMMPYWLLRLCQAAAASGCMGGMFRGLASVFFI